MKTTSPYHPLTAEEKMWETIGLDPKAPSVPDVEKLKKALSVAAKRTNMKSKQINLRVTASTLFNFKARAMRDGLPYQTVINSLIHKYGNGEIRSVVGSS
jgi:predicted DNA binding CopG/RHH family protein